MNSVHFILGHRPLSCSDKIAIKELGRPVPDLMLKIRSCGKSRDFNRYFKRETTYDRFSWMCGCPETNKLYCFVCLLSGDLKATQWTNQGVCDLQHLQERAVKHAHSTPHLNHLVDFNMLGDNNMYKQLNSAYIKAISDHNENVDKNRHMLRRLIMCVKFCGAFELAVHGRDSQGHGIFRGLLDFATEFGYTSGHLNQVAAFQENSKVIQNELLDAILQVCKDEIVDQVKRSNFVALIVEETADHQLVIIFRYFFEGQIYERFWDVIEKYAVEDIPQILLKELNILITPPSKLIAQSCNIAFNVYGRIEAAIREKYPNAFFVHSYFHHFRMILKNAACQIKEMKIFFADVHAFAKFFSRSSKWTDVLDELSRKRLSWTGTRSWNFKTGTVKELYGKTELFRECLQKIIDESNGESTISDANGLLRILDSTDFHYFLEILYPIVPQVEMFFNQVQSRGADSRFVQELLQEFESGIYRKCSDLCPQSNQSVAVNSIDDEFKEDVKNIELNKEFTPTASKRPRLEVEETPNANFLQCTTKVEFDIDEGMDASTSTSSKPLCIEDEFLEKIQIGKEYRTALVQELKKRYIFTGYISAAALFSPEMFQVYKVELPDSIFKQTISAYPFIDGTKLKMELAVIYSRKEMCCSGVLPLLGFIHRNNLKEGFSETYKLLDIICTTPMITSDTERCFLTLKRIKIFLKNTGDREKLSALAMLSVEKKMVQSIPDFDNKVINIFADGKDRTEFKYM